MNNKKRRTYDPSRGTGLISLRAEALEHGAPRSIEARLTWPLCNGFGFSSWEFEERLRLNLGKPGEWLAHRLRTNDGNSVVNDGLESKNIRKDGTTRFETAESISSSIVEKDDDNNQAVLRLRGIANVVKNASFVIKKDDVPVVIDRLKKGAEYLSEWEMAESWASLAGVCSWLDISRPLHERLETTKDFFVGQIAIRLPWTKWILCDEMLETDEGISFVELIISGESQANDRYKGAVLEQVLSLAPKNKQLLQLCSDFVASTTRNTKLTNAKGFSTAILTAFSEQLAEEHPDSSEKLFRLIETDAAHARSIVLSVAPLPAVSQAARQMLSQAHPAGFFENKFSRGLHGRKTLVHHPYPRKSVGDRVWSDVEAALETSWQSLSSLASVLAPVYWTQEDWSNLRETLLVGGHLGKSGTWLVSRIQLVQTALEYPESRSSLMDDSKDGVGFLRRAIWEGIGYGDDLVANSAVYVLPVLSRFIENDADADCVAVALRAAANDMRIIVAHGAAFAASYLLRLQELLREDDARHALHPTILEAAAEVSDQLANDPLAMIRRQANFGRAMADRHEETSRYERWN